MTAATTSQSAATAPAGGSLDNIQGPAVPGGRKRGRPRGSRSAPYDDVRVVTFFAKTACPDCGSSDRTKYYGRRDLLASGTEDGRPYRRVVLRRCRCLNCGKVRIDRRLTN